MLLHILTKKGKGYEPALKQPDKFHGLGKYEIESGETAPTATPTYSEIIRQDTGEIRGHQSEDRRHHGGDAERHGPCRISPRRIRTATSMSASPKNTPRFSPAGLATQGLKPFLTIYSTFFQRAYDMVIHDIAIQKLNVRLCMDRAGLSGDDGPTHHGLFDIGYLRHIPNLGAHAAEGRR